MANCYRLTAKKELKKLPRSSLFNQLFVFALLICDTTACLASRLA
jgi:hypothetical protein